MSNGFLFALDTTKQEVLVSQSAKGSNQVNFIERIQRSDNEIIFNAVQTLTSITKSTHFDVDIFNAMDKVCQMLYKQHKEKLT